MVIHKILLDPDVTYYRLPRGSEILSVAQQNNGISLWYKCDISQPLIYWSIHTFPTGHTFEVADLTFIDTVVLNDGLVFHVFAGRPNAKDL